ncbi:MAG TPA: hypothetical protein VFV38_35260 [Ktedonobacteraceae bacterium]|nr:hypothetical protein [Ktedonobacteraceae bacterium]
MMRNRDTSTSGPLRLSLTLLLLVLAACSTNGSGTTAPPITKKTPATRNCGAVQSAFAFPTPTDQDLAQGIEDCFWQAYQQCHPATLTYSFVGMDTVDIHTFRLQSQDGTCVITDTRQIVIEPGEPQPAGSSLCTGLTRQTDGLHFLACGPEGTVLVVPASCDHACQRARDA